jgi:hypothetical protein
MAIKVLVLAVAISYAIYLAVPTYFLEHAVGKETLEGVTERLGLPLNSKLKQDGNVSSVVNTYRVGSQPPLCVDYILTFEQKLLSDGTTFRPIMREWTWKYCGLMP